MKIYFNDEQHISWPIALLLLVTNAFLSIPNLLMNMVVFVLGGALAGWLIGFTPLGTWIAAGLNLIHIEAQHGDIYKIAAIMGFTKSFLGRPHTHSKTIEDKLTVLK